MNELTPLKNCKLTFETADGQIAEIFVTEFEINFHQPTMEFQEYGCMDFHSIQLGPMEIHGSYRGLGSPVFSRREEVVETYRKAIEWKCPYCGHVNLRDARYCGHGDTFTKGCGASRPVIYDL